MPNKWTILVVEDSMLQAEVLKRLLQRNGYDVITSSNGRLGLEVTLSDMPDLVISDIIMPEMNGYELCREIKGNKDVSRIPVILLTELKSVTDIIEGLQSLADDYITKPFNESCLISKIENYMNTTMPCEDDTDTGGFNVLYNGTSHTIYSNYKKVFNFLFATYDNVIHQYQEIIVSREELKQLNNELVEQAHIIRQSEEMFKFFVQTVPDVIYKIDADGRFTFINNSIRNYGYEPEELIGQHFSKIIKPHDLKKISKSEILPHFIGKHTGDSQAPKLFDERRGVDRKTINLEVNVKVKNPDLPNKSIIAEVSSYGIYRFDVDKHTANHDGTLGVIRHKQNDFLGSGGIIKDITEKKHTEKALFELEKIAHALMENACDAILIADVEGNILNANKKAVELMGYDKSELTQMKYADFHPEDDIQRMSVAFQRSVEEGTSYFIETNVLRKDGGMVPVEIAANIIIINGKRLMQGIFRDITERKLSQERLRRQEQLMINQSKMAAMGEMIGLIAHQWRQPLNSIGLSIQDIKDAYLYGELNDIYIRDVVDTTMDQICFMSKTIDDFRNFLKPSKVKVGFNVKSTIEGLVSMFELLFSKSGIDIAIRADHDATLSGYPNEFNQVILNLLNNSRDAIMSAGISRPSRGLIEIDISNSRERDKLLISVKDNGGGIPAQIIDRIFELYFTTKEQSGGTGIGLYMSKVVIEESLGGRIYAKNAENGAIFILEFNI
ncbi:MAG: PAS domain S-box protein [Nitrospirae bacterium]|nr:PAS domain S-box protein [Nitrospirota bacterium]